MIDDPVELWPVSSDLHHVVRIAEVRQVVRASGLRAVGRESLVDADVEETGMILELVLVSGDDRVRWIRDHFIVEPPTRKGCSGRRARRKSDVVALPRVRLHVLDLPLRVIAKQRIDCVAVTRIDLSVSERTRRAGDRVDVVAALSGLPAGENFTQETVVNVVCSPGHTAPRWREQRNVGVTDDRNAGLGFEVHAVDVLTQMKFSLHGRRRPGVGRKVGTELCRIPGSPWTAELVEAGRISASAVVGIAEGRCRGGAETRSGRHRPRTLRQRA